MSTKKKIITIIIGVEAVIIAAVIVFLFYINSDTVKVNRQLELAQRYLLEEDYEQAIAAFEIIIETDPKNADAYLGLAEAYAATDNLEKAVKILEKASKKVDSEEVLAMLEIHTAEIEQRELAAKRAAQAAAEAAQAAALAASEAAASSTGETTPTPQQDAAATETPASEPTPEPETVITGFVTQDGELYYYDEAGNLVTGWFDANSNRYCARNDGRLYRDGEHQIDGKKYLFDQSGVCLGEKKEDEWKQAYIDYIQQKHREYCSQYGNDYDGDRYALIYIDNDDIPELTVDDDGLSAEIQGAFIANYSNGAVHDNNGEDGGCSFLSYIERKNSYECVYGMMGYNKIEIWSITNGKQTLIAEGSMESTDEEGWGSDLYYWNGIQLANYEEFDREIDKVYNEDRAIRIDNIAQYTYKQIQEIITNF